MHKDKLSTLEEMYEKQKINNEHVHGGSYDAYYAT